MYTDYFETIVHNYNKIKNLFLIILFNVGISNSTIPPSFLVLSLRLIIPVVIKIIFR